MEKWERKSIRRRARSSAPQTPEPALQAMEPARRDDRPELLAARWPVLGAALASYQSNVAAAFAEEAYWCVEDGVIRMEERRRLEERAQMLGIRPFDAQLVMACAIRDWVFDHGPRRRKPVVRQGGGAWRWWVAALVAALVMDVVVVVWLFQ